MFYEKISESEEVSNQQINNEKSTSNTQNEEMSEMMPETEAVQENIPKLTAEEEKAIKDWQNSPEMQKGLQDMLPKEQLSEDPKEMKNLSAMILQWQRGNTQNTTQGPENNTGIPDELKASVEALSGYSMDEITVHYNSEKPAQVNALAYAEGSNIFIGPGQEEHLPHELAHIVQQKEGSVKPTNTENGMAVNNDASLEKEADNMGAKMENGTADTDTQQVDKTEAKSDVAQMKVIQKEEGTAVSWTPPKEGASACTAPDDAALKMALIAYDMGRLAKKLPEGADSAPLLELIEEMESWVEYLSTQEETTLTSYFTGSMSTFNEDYERIYSDGIRTVRQPILDAIRPLNAAKTVEPLDEGAKDALRIAFSEGSTSNLEQIGNLIASVKDYNEKINKWTGYIKMLGDNIRGAETLDKINKVTGNVAGIAEKMGHVITALQTMGTLLDASSTASTSSMQTINQMEATFKAIDLGMNFVKAVPVFGALWSNYYMPAIDMCFKGIRRIAALASEQAHQLVELEIQTRRDQSKAPELGLSAQHFPGGQVVLDFMWQVMLGNEVDPPVEVNNYFGERKDLFEAAGNSTMSVEDSMVPDFLEDNNAKGLYWWARTNRDIVWAMLYGSKLTAPS